MRPLTIDLHRLEYALDARDACEHYLDLESGDIRAVFPGESLPGADEKYDVQLDRFLHIEPLGLPQSIAMREAFLFTQHDPNAHAVLSAALRGRKPLRTFDFKLEDLPRGTPVLARLPDRPAARTCHHLAARERVGAFRAVERVSPHPSPLPGGERE